MLYRRLGRDIVARQEKEGWGAQVIDRLSADLRAAFPEMQGFSPRNLKYMRSFAKALLREARVRRRELRLDVRERLAGALVEAGLDLRDQPCPMAWRAYESRSSRVLIRSRSLTL